MSSPGAAPPASAWRPSRGDHRCQSRHPHAQRSPGRPPSSPCPRWTQHPPRPALPPSHYRCPGLRPRSARGAQTLPWQPWWGWRPSSVLATSRRPLALPAQLCRCCVPEASEPSGCRAPKWLRNAHRDFDGPMLATKAADRRRPCPKPRRTLLTLGGGGRSSKKSGNTSQSWSKVQHISLGRPYARLQGFPSPPSRRKMATCGAGPRLDCGRGRPSCRTDLTRRLITSWLW